MTYSARFDGILGLINCSEKSKATINQLEVIVNGFRNTSNGYLILLLLLNRKREDKKIGVNNDDRY